MSYFDDPTTGRMSIRVIGGRDWFLGVGNMRYVSPCFCGLATDVIIISSVKTEMLFKHFWRRRFNDLSIE